MDWIGLFRTLQPTLLTAVPIIIVIVFVYLVILSVSKSGANPQAQDMKMVRRVSHLGFALCMLVVLTVLAVKIAGTVATERLPRNSEERSEIYKQAEGNKTRESDVKP